MTASDDAPARGGMTAYGSRGHHRGPEGTIEVHLHRIYQKLAVQNRTALAALTNDVKRDTIPSTYDQHFINDTEQAPRTQTSRRGPLRSAAS